MLREAENKNGRYPWNIFQTEKTEADLDDFTNSRLSNRYLRNISTNIIKERYIEKINKLTPETNEKTLESYLSRNEKNSHLNSEENLNEIEWRIRPAKNNPKSLSLALDKFIEGVDNIEKELKHLKKSAKLGRTYNVEKLAINNQDN